MDTSSTKKRTEPTDTKQFGFSIIVPTDKHGAVPTVYKVLFGKTNPKYLIWKGKSLLQSCEILAKSISAGVSKMNRGIPIPESDYLYHVLKYIKSSRCTSASVHVEASDFVDEFGVIDGLKVLKVEQHLLDEADGDVQCLNNNEQSYVPINNVWISQSTKTQFLRWYQNRRKR